MRFHFDERKSKSLRRNPRRGIGFEEVQEVFFHPHYVDQRSDLPVQHRAIGWVGWIYRSGWVEWEFDWNAYASWYEAENFKEPGRIYNGSGQLIYRGAVMGYRHPIASIRLKAQRRGLQDHEYFWLLAERTGSKDSSDALVNGVIYKKPFGRAAMLDTEIWKNNPDLWDLARIAAGDRIAAK